MDDIYYEKLLYRILQGRLRLKLGDLVLFVHEPSRDDLEESFEIYDEAYKKAYFEGVFIKNEIIEILLTHEMWSPHDDREADKIEKQIEDLKVEAFKSFYDPRRLRGIKAHIRTMEKTMMDFKMKKTILDHTTCEGIAGFAQKTWLISSNTRNKDGSDHQWSKYSISTVMDRYAGETIDHSDMRKIARSHPWRPMWSLGKSGTNLFGGLACDMTGDQANLCSYSSMYDSVYESSETPKEKVIEDDDCLDGWFIVQRREVEKMKKQQEIEQLTSNPKIANSQEVFLMANSQEGAKEILDLNHPHSRGIIAQRDQQIEEAGSMSFTKFADVQQDLALQSNQAQIDKMKSK